MPGHWRRVWACCIKMEKRVTFADGKNFFSMFEIEWRKSILQLAFGICHGEISKGNKNVQNAVGPLPVQHFCKRKRPVLLPHKSPEQLRTNDIHIPLKQSNSSFNYCNFLTYQYEIYFLLIQYNCSYFYNFISHLTSAI